MSEAASGWSQADEDHFGPDEVIALTGVSRETLERVGSFLRVLDEWRGQLNLMGPAEFGRIWRRHVLDSLQLVRLMPPTATRVADLGSGGGFPGIPLSCVLAGRPGAVVSLVEKSPRKCEFLNEAIHKLDLPAVVICSRIEDAPPVQAEVVTARALSPLDRLLGQAERHLRPGGIGLFLKGRDHQTELAAARRNWAFTLSAEPSLSGPDGRVLLVSSIERVTA
jgi:16S rRNA (guanine527-N7)-methyltransferase